MTNMTSRSAQHSTFFLPPPAPQIVHAHTRTFLGEQEPTFFFFFFDFLDVDDASNACNHGYIRREFMITHDPLLNTTESQHETDAAVSSGEAFFTEWHSRVRIPTGKECCHHSAATIQLKPSTIVQAD